MMVKRISISTGQNFIFTFFAVVFAAALGAVVDDAALGVALGASCSSSFVFAATVDLDPVTLTEDIALGAAELLLLLLFWFQFSKLDTATIMVGTAPSLYEIPFTTWN